MTTTFDPARPFDTYDYGLHSDDLECFRNVFKSVHGVNPRSGQYPTTPAAFNEAMRALDAHSARMEALEAEQAEQEAAEREAAIHYAMGLGAPTRADAARWMGLE